MLDKSPSFIDPVSGARETSGMTMERFWIIGFGKVGQRALRRLRKEGEVVGLEMPFRGPGGEIRHGLLYAGEVTLEGSVLVGFSLGAKLSRRSFTRFS